MLRPPVTVSAGSARSFASAAASVPSIPLALAKATPVASAALTGGAAPRAARPPPDSTIARWNSPLPSGEAISAWIENPPADSPNTVTCAGSPPNAAMLRFTHCSAAIWSMKA